MSERVIIRTALVILFILVALVPLSFLVSRHKHGRSVRREWIGQIPVLLGALGLLALLALPLRIELPIYGGVLVCFYSWLLWRTRLSLPTIALATLNLATPAALVFLLLPVFYGRASACNLPAVVFRGVVSGVFSLGTVALATGRPRFGRTVTWAAVLLSVLMIAWVWLHSGVVFTTEIVGWLVVDALTVLLLLLLGQGEGWWQKAKAA